MIDQIKQLVYENCSQPNVLGVLLMGSVSADAHDQLSDVDLLVVYQQSEPVLRLPNTAWKWDISYMSEEEIKGLQKFSDWRANAFLTAQIIVDHTTWLPSVIHEICTLSDQESERQVTRWLDAYLNAFYRSMKAVRRNNELGSLLQASSSIMCLINCLFSMNKLIPPYLDRVDILLDRLEHLPMQKTALSERFAAISQSANPKDQIILFRATEKLLRSFGFNQVYEAWGDQLESEVNYWEG
ncbi:nucleotidyltransferase domain-containing protein [Paenibacillus favisporus]|uniref:nucleotidyltransferase domain-containing protein n=1 Tax=Paenibacillus favisporus TaxID=221028 RepID=UPI0013D3E146|nr:nucleotidyltransferase domain-containing protein [Paenibacillus favisporus]